jgi:cytochrome c peroxidase
MSKAAFLLLSLAVFAGSYKPDGEKLFERETFGGNGRTCRTCHSRETGTVSPQDARRRFRRDPGDPLFVHDGSDDGKGNGVTLMLRDATIRMTIEMAPNVELAADPAARSMLVTRGIPTTINTPALDPVLMLDGRQPTLESQAIGAIRDHGQATNFPNGAELEALVGFEQTRGFFSSPELRHFANGGRAPELPKGYTPSEKRGRRFFEDVVDAEDPKHGLCAACHSGPMLNQTNLLAQIAFGIPVGTRFQDILVSELNVAGNPVQEFVFNNGQANERHVFSPDIGRSAITGVTDVEDTTFSNLNAFKIPQLRGIGDTAPYFHDNSAKTLAEVLTHYTTFFQIVTSGAIQLTDRDRKDVIAFMKLLD